MSLIRIQNLFLTQKLEVLCLNQDSTFGNARFVRNLFNETKIELSKRYQLLQENEKDFAALNTIDKDDIDSAITNLNNRNRSDHKSDLKVDKYLNEINNLVGLDDVKILF